MFLRLLCRAPTDFQASRDAGSGRAGELEREVRRGARLGLTLLLRSLLSCSLLPLLHPPVRRHGDRLLAGEIRPGDRAAAAVPTCSGVPWATICPPWRPAAGTEIEQLVGVARSLRGRARPPAACCPGRGASSGRPTGGGCRGDAGRSSARRARRARRTARCPPAPARRMRCISPPESVGAGRASVRYSSPRRPGTAARLRISRSTSPAIFRSSAVELPGLETRASSLPSGRRQISSIVRPRKPHGRRIVAQAGCRRRPSIRLRRPGVPAAPRKPGETRLASSKAG